MVTQILALSRSLGQAANEGTPLVYSSDVPGTGTNHSSRAPSREEAQDTSCLLALTPRVFTRRPRHPPPATPPPG